MRALGLVTGDLWSVITGRPRKKPPPRQTLRSRTTEEVRRTDESDVVLRRTIIEEMEVRRPPA
jgi:hypothetical protein